MHYLASIVPGSATDRLWRRMNRPSGEVGGVLFRARPPGPTATSHAFPIYFSGEISSDQVAGLAGYGDVRLEAMGLQLEQIAPEPPAPLGDESASGVSGDTQGRKKNRH